MPTLAEIDQIHQKALEQGVLVFRYVQGFDGDEDIGEGICFALSYTWITQQLRGKLPLEGIVDRTSLARGIPLSTPIASRFPNLVQLPVNDHIKRIQGQSKDGYFGIRNQAGLDGFECITVATGAELQKDNAAQTILSGINACHKQLQRGFGMIGLRREGGGHAIAFQILTTGTARLFDPNLGEFKFKTIQGFGLNFKKFMSFMGYDERYDKQWSIFNFKPSNG